jgi:hypothetical protein
MTLCECKTIDDRKLTVLRRIDEAAMSDGSHTSFYLLECDICHGLWGFPQENFILALDHGWTADQTNTNDIHGHEHG